MAKCENCYHKKVCINGANYKNAENCKQYKPEELIIELPCRVGDKVYVIATCHDFPPELDGSWETATGYYCPCELRDNCPHNADDCESVVNTEAVFTDQITYISECEGRMNFDTGYTGCYNISDFGKTVFLTREEAERALEEREKNG